MVYARVNNLSIFISKLAELMDGEDDEVVGGLCMVLPIPTLREILYINNK